MASRSCPLRSAGRSRWSRNYRTRSNQPRPRISHARSFDRLPLRPPQSRWRTCPSHNWCTNPPTRQNTCQTRNRCRPRPPPESTSRQCTPDMKQLRSRLNFRNRCPRRNWCTRTAPTKSTCRQRRDRTRTAPATLQICQRRMPGRRSPTTRPCLRCIYPCRTTRTRTQPNLARWPRICPRRRTCTPITPWTPYTCRRGSSRTRSDQRKARTCPRGRPDTKPPTRPQKTARICRSGRPCKPQPPRENRCLCHR
jgi:hypothetical protein